MQFDKFAPYLPKHNILFNIYGELIKQHPVVIWFNGNERMFYFVKAHSANKDEMEKDHFLQQYKLEKNLPMLGKIMTLKKLMNTSS